jgi:hypothetical protein
MGNITPRPTNRLNMFVTEVNDISFNLSSNVAQVATQNVVIEQVQNVIIGFNLLDNCNINITQSTQADISQTVAFRNMFTNPRDFINKMTKGPNSLVEQILKSQSQVMKDFLDAAKDAFNVPSGSDDEVIKTLRGKFITSIKSNINRQSLQMSTQNIFVSQQQSAQIIGNICKNSNINILQELLIKTSQNAIFEVLENSLTNDIKIRQCLRKLNGDYDVGLLDSNMDAGAKIPDACYNLNPIRDVMVPCPPCEGCVVEAPQLKVVTVEKILDKNLVFQAWFLYSSLVFFLGILLFLFYVKISKNKKQSNPV